MKNKLLLILTSCLFLSQLKAQTIVYAIYSGPSFKSVDYSANIAGPGWNSLGYNDSAWNYSFNGSGAQGGASGCAGPNQSGWGSNDTIIWSNQIANAPDTACFRKTISLPKCGTVTAANFSPGADDYYFFYINGNFMGTNPVDGSGVPDTLTTPQLSWFVHGDNVIAAQVVNSAPSCGFFTLLGTITVDTVGCANATAGINDIGASQVSIFPNPTSSIVKVQMSGVNAPFSLIVFDQIGQVVQSQVTSNNSTSIDLRNMAKGIYMLEVTDAKGQRIDQKLVKD